MWLDCRRVLLDMTKKFIYSVILSGLVAIIEQVKRLLSLATSVNFRDLGSTVLALFKIFTWAHTDEN